MELAYIILTHKNHEQIIRLIQRLNTTHVKFFINVDKKATDEIYHHITKKFSNYPNVFFIKRCRVYWGDFGMVEATLEGIKEIYRRHITFDYVVLLTGQDYPIKTNDQIINVLQEAGDKSCISFNTLPMIGWPNGGLNRFEHWHFHVGDRSFHFPEKYQFEHLILKYLLNPTWSLIIRLFPLKRRFLNNFIPYGGSAYWCLSKDCIDYIYHFINHNRNYVNFFKTVLLPEEMFFQTIILNSPFKEKIIKDDQKYIDWTKPNSPHPAILGVEDFESLAKSSKLFARKFDMMVDLEVLDMIDQQILGIMEKK